MCGRLVSVQAGETDVAHDHFRLMLQRGVTAGGTVMSLDDFMPDLLQVQAEHLCHVDVVIDHEHPFGRCRARNVGGGGALCQGWRGVQTPYSRTALRTLQRCRSAAM